MPDYSASPNESRRGISLLPRIDNLDAKTLEVLYVTRNNLEGMFEGGSHGQTVRDLDLFPMLPKFPREHAPSFRNRGPLLARCDLETKGRNVPSSHSCKPPRRLLAGRTVNQR